ncbi:hypothetical protein BGZ76_007790 [Entomortierella beljakovae]|nr:hypothetical protein BGZ76_007790 [Entomortierella beljakovae]
MEHPSGDEQLRNQSPSNPRPPVLTFRSFHERHFSKARQQEFFASAYHPPWDHQPFNWSHGYNAFSTEATHGVDETYRPYQTHRTPPFESMAEEESDEERTENHEAGVRDNYVKEDHKPPMPNLSKEAIEIFEFSRRFRQEKEAAKLSEQKKIRKRKTKRRRLTELGFAIDEGNSGSEADDIAIGGLIDDENAKSDDDESDDDSVIAQEPGPSDVLFMLQKSRRSDKMRQDLYGQDPNISEIEMLECLVNQTYEDSLIPQNFASEASGQDKRVRPHLEGNQGSNQRKKVVYWPGMPLRC